MYGEEKDCLLTRGLIVIMPVIQSFKQNNRKKSIIKIWIVVKCSFGYICLVAQHIWLRLQRGEAEGCF